MVRYECARERTSEGTPQHPVSGAMYNSVDPCIKPIMPHNSNIWLNQKKAVEFPDKKISKQQRWLSKFVLLQCLIVK